MKFSTVNSQNRHLACLEARFLPRNLFHFYKKSPHPVRDTLFSPKFPVSLQRSTSLRSNPVRDTPFSADFPVSLPHFPSFPSYLVRDTLFSPKFPVSLQRSTALRSNPIRDTLFSPKFPVSRSRSLRFRLFLLAPNPLSLSDFLNPRAPHLRHALSVIA